MKLVFLGFSFRILLPLKKDVPMSVILGLNRAESLFLNVVPQRAKFSKCSHSFGS